MDEEVAIQFAADTAAAVSAVRDLAANAQALADTAKEAADGVAGIAAPAAEAAAGADEVAAAADKAAGSLGLYVDAAGRARLANGQFATSAQAAAAGAKEAGAASEGAAAKSGAAAESGLGKYKMALVGVGIGTAVAVDGAVKYQAETTRLVTSAGESASNLDKVRAGMLSLSSQTGTSTAEMANGMYTIESAGFHGAQGLTVLKAAAQGAKDEGADLATVSNAVTDALVDYHLPASSAANVTSQLITAVSHGKTTFQDFSGSMSNILPLASSLHLKLSDVSGVLAEMTAHGMSADQASQDEANAMRELMKPNAAMVKEMTALHITSQQVYESLGTRGLAGTMQWLSGVAKDGSAAIGQNYTQALGKLMGTAPGLVTALMTTGENAKATGEAIKGIGGATADAKGNVIGFSEVSQTAAFKLSAAKESAAAMGISLGEALLPAVMDVLGPLTRFLQLVASNHAAAIAFAIVVGGILAGALGLKLAGALKDAKAGIEAAGEGLAWLAGKMGIGVAATEAQTAATEAATVAQGELDVAMDANPIGLIIIAIVALIAIIVLLVTHTHEVAHIFDLMRHDVAAAVDWLVHFVESHWQLLATILATVLLGPVGGLVVFLATHWQQVSHDVSVLVSTVVGFFERLPGQILGLLEKLPGDMLSIGQNIVRGLINGIASMGSFLSSSIVNLVPSPIRSLVSGALGIFSPSTVFHGYGRNLVQGLVNGVREMQPQLRAAMSELTGGVTAAGSAYAASAVAPASGGTSVHVTAPLTVQAGSGYDTPQFQQYLQAAMQEATLRYGQINPTNGLTPAWGR